MTPILKKGLFGIISLALTASAAFSAGPGETILRKMKLGDQMPEFSLADTQGKVFEYKHNRGRVLVIAFLAAGQKQSLNAYSDIKQILADPKIKSEPVDVVGVMTRPPDNDLFESGKSGFPILLDTEYKMWGELGVIAMPTVLIVGKDDSISWIRAGHAYDFAPAVRSHLNFALGLAGQEAPEETIEARALNNDTVASRVDRHLHVAKILEEKGLIDSAIEEIRKAQALEPDSFEAILELGALLCRAGKGKAALEEIEKVQTANRRDQARLMLVCGWAKRQLNDLTAAEKDLLEATKLDPRSARGYFELGRVYEAKGDKDKALAAYRRALALVFGEY